MPSPTTSLVTRKSDQSNMFTASSETDLLKQVVQAFSTINQWILAFGLDNDIAAVIASLDTGRNCIQLVPTESRANAVHRELNKRQLKMDEENRESAVPPLASDTESSSNGGDGTASASQNTQDGVENGQEVTPNRSTLDNSMTQYAQESLTQGGEQQSSDPEVFLSRQEQEPMAQD
ncbi:uncharacterized protein [Amphiura filiformis]|uniref:uncharacterized protein n=1 Tax=Amphiura filiformis TaxID=82378 RepID=UPI003B21EF07